jgi:leucyl-tRNA synthetase
VAVRRRAKRILCLAGPGRLGISCEHAVLHLLYARFYTKFLYDIGVVDFEEPFVKLFNQGMITKNGSKMSKSVGNVVSPDDLVNKYGCDSLRLYELFVGPPEQDSEWDDSGIDGVFRYLSRTWKFVLEYKDRLMRETEELARVRNKFIFEITNRIEAYSMNTVVSGFMEFTSKMADEAKKAGGIDKESLKTLIVLLSPFAPHIAEELWESLGNTRSVFNEKWPVADAEKMKDKEVEIAIQINGKLRGSVMISRETEKDAILQSAREAVAKRLEGADIVKEIYVPLKIVNFVVKEREE